LIVINFDEGGLSEQVTSSGVPILAPGRITRSNLAAFPQTTNIIPTITLTFESYGGDPTCWLGEGAVLLSPFLKPGSVSETPFKHYSLVQSLEDICETEGHLGYAAAPGLVDLCGCVSSDIATKEPGFKRCPADCLRNEPPPAG
jgi:hypothetical protein